MTEVFEAAASHLSIEMAWGVVVTPKSIFTYIPPENFTWIVTYIFLRSLPPINDPSLTEPGTSSGDFRSDDFEVSGLTKAWIAVNSNAISGQDVSTYGLFHKPLLLAFEGGQQVDVFVQRNAASIPPTQEIHIALHGYLAPPCAYDRLVRNATTIEGFFS
jgi:hypothetical protein